MAFDRNDGLCVPAVIYARLRQGRAARPSDRSQMNTALYGGQSQPILDNFSQARTGGIVHL
jgi:hypothetical protein